jgi:cobaltochelatase CobT
MGRLEALTRHQQRLDERAAGAIRALTGQRDVHFRGRRLYRGRERLPSSAAHLHPRPGIDADADFRGAADGLALRLARSDAALHRRLAPAHPHARMVFDLLEQLRAESLLPAAWVGVRRNLQRRFEGWSRDFVAGRLAETSRGLLLFTLAQVCRARLGGEPVPAAFDELIEGQRFALVPAIGPALAALARHRQHQAAYAQPALHIAQVIAAQLSALGGDDEDRRQPDEREASETDERTAFGFVLETEAAAGDEPGGPAPGRSDGLDAAASDYRVWTRQWDREAMAPTLVRAEQLAADRVRLDALVAAQAIDVHRLARELHLRLAVASVDGWVGAQEEGRIDGRRLAQLVCSPLERHLFTQARVQPQVDAALTLLLDCSGSMRVHAPCMAVLADRLARAATLAGIAVEVAGFTTASWQGGKAWRDWQRAGRPLRPGRLAERLHIVFKSHDQGWPSSRKGFAALLREDLFRESLDGEALEWAAARLRLQPQARRVLVVVSDGCPMEAATELANDRHYLDHHLQAVVEQVQSEPALELVALGVGLDLSPWYRRSRAVDLPGQTPAQVLRELLELLPRRAGGQ